MVPRPLRTSPAFPMGPGRGWSPPCDRCPRLALWPVVGERVAWGLPQGIMTPVTSGATVRRTGSSLRPSSRPRGRVAFAVLSFLPYTFVGGRVAPPASLRWGRRWVGAAAGPSTTAAPSAGSVREPCSSYRQGWWSPSWPSWRCWPVVRGASPQWIRAGPPTGCPGPIRPCSASVRRASSSVRPSAPTPCTGATPRRPAPCPSSSAPPRSACSLPPTTPAGAWRSMQMAST